VRILLCNNRHAAFEPLVLPQKGAIFHMLALPPHLYDVLDNTATEPHGEAKQHQHRQNQCAEAERTFDR
jgi:hypothetical protein